jgi:hypothetical protein
MVLVNPHKRHPRRALGRGTDSDPTDHGGNYFPLMANFTGARWVAGCGLRVAGLSISDFRFRISDCFDWGSGIHPILDLGLRMSD